MKKLIITTTFCIIAILTNAQELEYYVSPVDATDTLRVNDTITVGKPTITGQYTTIQKNVTANIKKAKKGIKLAGLAGSVVGAVGLGTGTISGVNTAIKGVRIANAAAGIEDIMDASESISNNTTSKRMIITKLYTSGEGLDQSTFAEAVNSKGTKFTISIPEALMLQEVLITK